jgi:signal transduction histidine kinase
LILPDGEGDEIIRMVPSHIKTKIIVLSGDTDLQRRNHIFESGILDYFSKSNPTHLLIDDLNNLFYNVSKNSSINILIVDDSSFMRKLLKNTLLPKRYNIIEAKDAQDGLEKLNNNKVDLILLDLELPGIHGAEMLEIIKKQPKYLELPIIILSSNDSKDVVARVLKHGARDFIKKPFITEELLLKCDLQIRDYLNIQQLKQKEIELNEALETAQTAQKQKSIFLANMSHEIRTPLNSILGFIELLKEENLSSEKNEYIDTISSCGDNLLNIVNDILDLSKVQSNQLNINKQPFNLNKLYENIINIFKPLMEQRNINFTYTQSENTPITITSDYLRIKQILSNLLHNALKFTQPNGKISFKIDFNDSENILEFVVQDNGIGIKKQNQKKIFDPFVQADDYTQNYKGFGLGLAISSQLSTLLDGKIKLSSQYNHGSTFIFSLPVKIENNNIISQKEIKENSTSKQPFDANILLVEDNIANQQFMTIMLKKLGITIDIANDGIEAIEMSKDEQYDLILMDENMPNMNGSLAMQHIIEYEKNHNKKHIPIVMLTANAIEEQKDIFLKYGADGYLSKPIIKNKLFEIFNKFLLNKGSN